jgi:phage FluMu protein Com
MIAAVDQQNTQQKPKQPFRCNNCNRVLALVYLVAGSFVEIKCPYCRAMNVKDKP